MPRTAPTSALEQRLLALWYGGRGAGGIGALALQPLAWVYAAIIRVRKTLYGSGILKPVSVGPPVIVVGNLTVGGTGKTPLTLWLADRLVKQGFTVGIVLRGYHASASRTPQLVTQDADPVEVGDEALLLASRCQCPVAIGANRVAAARLVVNEGVQVILSDDGLQHLRLARECEIVVIDGERRFGNGRLLPAGPLREPVSRLKKVDAIVVSGAAATFAEHAMSLTLGDAVSLVGGAARPLKSFTATRVHAIAGIGHPARFFHQLRAAGLNIIEHPFPDHHAYTAEDLRFHDDLPVLMTEKDAVKCRAFADARLWAVPATAQFDAANEQALLGIVLRKIKPRPVR